MPRRAARGVAAIALLGAFLACAGGSAPPRAWDEPEAEIVWPEPPEPARIAYAGAIGSAADLGRRPGFFQRVKDTLFGVEPTPMVRPISVAVNDARVLVVADPGVPAVHWFDLEGKQYRQIGEKLDEPLRSPVGVAIDAAGWVYVSDSARARVFVFGPDLRFVAEMGEDILLRPTGLAFDRSGKHLYVVDSVGCRVVVFDRTGSRVGSFGRRGVGPGELNAPTHIAVSPDGTINVSDSLNFRVQRFAPDGTALGFFGTPGDMTGHFGRPKGIAADSAGRLYVADAAFENVQIFEPDGTLLLSFGGPGTRPGRFTLPSGLFMDASDTIWVADSFNRRVQTFKLLAGEP
jgi:sugar lactone lactonase YvrE